MTIFRPIGLVALLASAALMTGCSVVAEPRVTRLPSDGVASAAPSASPSPSVTVPQPSVVPVDVTDCAGHALVIDAGSAEPLVGDCPDVQVQGNDLTIDTTGATVGILQLSGDRITARLGSADAVTLMGNDGDVSASGIASLTVQGDRNSAVTTGGADRILLQGNDNSVHGPVGQVTDQGARNAID